MIQMEANSNTTFGALSPLKKSPLKRPTTCWCSVGNEGMTLLNQFPHSLLTAPAFGEATTKEMGSLRNPRYGSRISFDQPSKWRPSIGLYKPPGKIQHMSNSNKFPLKPSGEKSNKTITKHILSKWRPLPSFGETWRTCSSCAKQRGGRLWISPEPRMADADAGDAKGRGSWTCNRGSTGRLPVSTGKK